MRFSGTKASSVVLSQNKAVELIILIIYIMFVLTYMRLFDI